MSYQTINPFTEKLVKTFPEQTDEQLKSIISQAHDTFSNDWGKRSIADRKKILKNAVKLFRERREELAQYITLEMGKLLTESRGEVDLSADILEYYADNAEAFLAPEKLKVSGGEAVVENTPLGVLFCIEPWNFPYYQLARVAGPNLMLGNTLIVKHAPNVPMRRTFRSARWRSRSCSSKPVLRRGRTPTSSSPMNRRRPWSPTPASRASR